MTIEVKNPIYLIILNWIIILIGSLGIPSLNLDSSVGPTQQYILSFLAMNYDIFHNTLLVIISWVISLIIFGIFVHPDWKIPLYGIAVESVIYIFSIVLIKRHSPITFELMKFELLQEFGIICSGICLLFIPVLIRLILTKRSEKTEVDVEQSFISKCPYCGKEYQSNPIFCYMCSKRI